jgi:hypothetical protein
VHRRVVRSRSRALARTLQVGEIVAAAILCAVFAATSAAAEAPAVTLNPLPLRSSEATPSFSGTASGTAAVVVEVFSGGAAQGEPLATLSVRGTRAAWASAHLSVALKDGTYSAIARQTAPGGATGTSNAISFEVDTHAPTVTLARLPTRSNDTAPTFSGTASEGSAVTVLVYAGPKPEGSLVGTAEASRPSGTWSAPLGEPLEAGEHTFTAIAVQASELGNERGESEPVTFVVDTEAPHLSLEAQTSPSNVTTPTFSGSTNEAGEVTVAVFAGTATEGQPLQTVSTTVVGPGWTTPRLGAPLADGSYTALATQASAIGNAPGASAPVRFTVDTAPPMVTLNSPLSPSANRQPSFSGTASDSTIVTIRIYSGASAEGPPLETVTAEPSEGRWSSGRAGELPAWGQYTAVAVQPSSIHNPDGTSAPATFSVQPIPPNVVSEAAASVTRTSAALYASVDPQGATVSECVFEFGLSTAYGKSLGCGFVSGISAFPREARGAVQVFVRIYGLTPGAGYHYRIVAIGEGGRAAGADETFTTLPPWPQEAQPGTPAVASAGATVRAVAARIAAQLRPRGRGARIASLLRNGGFRQLLAVPAAGRAFIRWSYVPTRAPAKASTARPVLLGYGQASFSAAETAPVLIRLTPIGTGILRAARHLRLTATCAFIPRTGARIRASTLFELAR